ncbi:Crp/Fnr family transcriptional regulator [Aestuariivirga sp.]|uniref:Crp/Fnr family transcriptional regulator n=1 Tax=Aestuariivirga sp. TaxID=2650926 RepID=UPI0035B01143
MDTQAIPGLEPASAARLAAARPVALNRGQAVFQPGQACAAFLIVTAGSVKVSTVTSSGRELMLYRVGPGETCVLTTACLLAGADYDAEGMTETEVEALAVPKPLFEELMAESPAFRRFVFSSYGVRLRDLIGLVQDVSQRQVDRRLARFLAERAGAPLALTHQEIATELGTAREVVSRLLKQFAGEGLVEIERRSIVVAAPQRLARLAEGL